MNIVSLRLRNQQLIMPGFTTVKDIVGWMGAMQSQDYGMSKLAIGLRLPNATDSIVEKAIDKAEIIRTHLMRPTWHWVSANDVHWMLALTATRVKGLMKTNNKRLGLDEAIFKKTNKVIEKVLSQNEYALRDVIAKALEKVKIGISENRLAHYLMRAELDGIACNGPTVNKQRSYALLSAWVPAKKIITKEESLAMLATKYFQSHGPATLADFVWWSGLTNKDAKEAIDMVQKDFESITIASQTYFYKPVNESLIAKSHSVFLLPAYDEFIIAYTDRSAALASEYHSKTVSINGIFKPTIIVRNKVTGLWKKSLQKDNLEVTAEWFKDPKVVTGSLKKAAGKLQQFYTAKSVKIL